LILQSRIQAFIYLKPIAKPFAKGFVGQSGEPLFAKLVHNIAKLFVGDATDSLGEEIMLMKEPTFWHTVPKKIIYSYIKDEETDKAVKALVKQGRTASSLFYSYDLRMNPLRLAYVLIHNRRYYKKYKLYP
jgi:D-aspartate ligase